MTNRPLFLFLFLIILVTQVSGITVSPAKFTTILEPGQGIVYSISIKLLPEEELETISTTCPELVTATNTSIRIIAPTGNGIYTCKVGYHLVSSGKLKYSIGVPLTITIGNGIQQDPPIISQPTEKPTTLPTESLNLEKEPTVFGFSLILILYYGILFSAIIVCSVLIYRWLQK